MMKKIGIALTVLLLTLAFIPKEVLAVTLGEYEAKVKKYTKERLEETELNV